jgi:hypothetical protein
MIHVDQIFMLMLFCGLFALVCGSTLVFGLRLINKHIGVNNKFALIYYSFLLSVIAFEFMLIGTALDPRATTYDWKYKITISIYAGIITFLGVMAITLIYFLIVRIIRWLYSFVTNFLKK